MNCSYKTKNRIYVIEHVFVAPLDAEHVPGTKSWGIVRVVPLGGGLSVEGAGKSFPKVHSFVPSPVREFLLL